MNTRNIPSQPIARILALTCFLSLPLPMAAAGTIRSTVYDGASWVEFPARAEYDGALALTLEAWVLLESSNGCQTIVEHGVGQSYWFAACPTLQFMRGGTTPVQGTGQVPLHRWTHVAVSYDGQTARFYIDGAPAGTAAHPYSGDIQVLHSLHLGASHAFGYGAYLHGQLDEVRIWSQARTQAEIRDHRFEQLRGVPAQMAVFGDGGMREELGDDTPIDSGGQPVESFRGMLPRDLLVPRTPFAQLDGQINLSSEYRDAEQLVLRHGAGQGDGVAYLVHDDEALWIGIPSSSIVGPNLLSWLGVFVDPDHSRDLLAQTSDRALQLDLTTGEAHVLHGNGTGSYVVACLNPASDLERALCEALRIDVQTAFCEGGDDVGTSKCAEIRIPRTLLGGWSQVDGLALGQMRVTGPTDDHLAPADAAFNSPVTWASVSYSDAGATFPEVTAWGWVRQGISPDPVGPMAGYTVRLQAGSLVVAETQTDASGLYEFRHVPVPSDADLFVAISSCAFCRTTTPVVGTGGLPPLLPLEPASVRFAPCASSLCVLSPVEFFVQPPLGPAVLDHASDTTDAPRNWGAPAVVLRDAPFTTSAADLIRLHGENLHPWLQVYLRRQTTSQLPEQWELHPATIEARAQDGSWIEVRLPTFPHDQHFPSLHWRWVLADQWVRPGYHAWVVMEGEDFDLVRPAAPMIDGFGFKNDTRVGSIWGNFYAVYGDNAYICLGVPGLCACKVPDPFYQLVWFWVYWGIRANMTGNCAGMASTSLLAYHGDLAMESFDPAVHHPAGFTAWGPVADYDYDLCGPAEPVNLSATIETNQGVVLSAELLHEALADFGGGLGSSLVYWDWEIMQGDPVARLAEIRDDLHGQVLCMWPDSISDMGTAHCVLGYRVEDVSDSETHIRVWDSNKPWPSSSNALSAKIIIDKGANTYHYSSSLNGTRLVTIPLSVWRGGRHAPSIANALALSLMLVIGAGEAIYSFPEADAMFRGKGIPPIQALPFPLPGAAAGFTPSPRLAPVAAGAPLISLRQTGGDLLFHAMRGPRAFQLQVLGGRAGDDFELAAAYDGNDELASFSLRPDHDAAGLVLTTAFSGGERESLVFRWAGLSVPAGHTTVFTLLPEQHGVEVHNLSRTGTRYLLLVDHVAGAASAQGSQLFGPFGLAAGARHRTVLQDWPAGAELRLEIDRNRDGRIDSVEVARGLPCRGNGIRDRDGNDIDDRCDLAATGVIRTALR